MMICFTPLQRRNSRVRVHCTGLCRRTAHCLGDCSAPSDHYPFDSLSRAQERAYQSSASVSSTSL